MTGSEVLMVVILVVVTLLSLLVSVLRVAHGGALQQIRGVIGVLSGIGLLVTVVTVMLIFHRAQSQLGPSHAPNIGLPTETTIPSFSGSFATPSATALTR